MTWLTTGSATAHAASDIAAPRQLLHVGNRFVVAAVGNPYRAGLRGLQAAPVPMTAGCSVAWSADGVIDASVRGEQ